MGSGTRNLYFTRFLSLPPLSSSIRCSFFFILLPFSRVSFFPFSNKDVAAKRTGWVFVYIHVKRQRQEAEIGDGGGSSIASLISD